jgi:asparagine synthase (glutamine-hydrolysing)
MCGIAGIVMAPQDATVEPETLHQMCATLVHRGPDDEGIFVEGPVGLGMRRLSIIDLTGGRQPIHNEDETIWAVFNGEIYNFGDLRTELEGNGHRFYTRTDTEVIVHLYEDLGSNCVQKLRGMFAFAIYDGRQKRILLARDRLGKKPLHYSITNGRLLFASEIKAILAVAPELNEVDSRALLRFFYFGYIPDPDTVFGAIKKLPPGHALEFANGTGKLRQYWDLPSYGAMMPNSERECLEELETRLFEAVKIRLISDVPLGALLSGGVDSSTVVGLMARALSRPVKTFSISFRYEDFNEGNYARAVARRFGTDHHELVVEPNIEGALDKLTHMLEEPFGDSSMLPTYFVSYMARQHVTVALSGDGGDELFAGYDRYPILLRRRGADSLPAWAGRWYRDKVYHWVPSGFYGRNLLFNLSLPWRDRYLDDVSFLPVYGRERFLFSPEFLACADESFSPTKSFVDYFDRAPARDPVSQLLYLDTKTYLPGDILTKVDRMSMATSLELRAPILDHVFVEWVTSLPAHLKLRKSGGKYIFKKLAEQVGVPRHVIYREKKGFALPLVHWLRKEMKDGLPSLLFEPRTLQRGYFNTRNLRKLTDEHYRGRRDHSAKIWLLLMFELWHRNFLEAQGDEAPQPLSAQIFERGIVRKKVVTPTNQGPSLIPTQNTR